MRYFFVPDIVPDLIALDEDSSKHITGVLRMKRGEELVLTDGKGTKAAGVIDDDHRKRCTVRVVQRRYTEPAHPAISIAISLVKNVARFEWFLEKAAEIGVTEIIPLLCDRTEKEKFRMDRLQNILVSALLQSQQSWMPLLHEPQAFGKLVAEHGADQKFIAHCLDSDKLQLANAVGKTSALILIGPEGDFTPAEITTALGNGFRAVALGNTRLRTETAGMVAASLLRIGSL